MKISIEMEENIESQHVTYHVTLAHREIIEAGPPPKSFILTADRTAYVLDPAVNPAATHSLQYKLLQVAWLMMQTEMER